MQRTILVSSLLLAAVCLTNAQRITTIQLDGVQYFVSRMNPYSPELNYFLSYQYCRSLGLQLASFETREKADSITQYLSNAGYNKYDFWTSGNKLGTDMFLWMSTGLPFNATFNYIKRPNDSVESAEVADVPTGSTSPQRTARESGDSGSMNSCIALKAPNFEWESQDCMAIKDFICEQTRCYYYNYGSIPVSSAQGRPVYSTTARPPLPFTTTITAVTQSPAASPPLNKFIPQAAAGISELINKLRSTSATASPAILPSPVNLDANANVVYHLPAEQSSAADSNGVTTTTNNNNNNDDDDDEERLGAATNGPYTNAFVGLRTTAEMRDDPNAFRSAADDAGLDEEAATANPEIVTIISPQYQP